MKSGVLLSAFLIIVASAVFAQLPGSIGLFSDTAGMDCNVYDHTSGLISIYAVHINTPGSTSSRFMVDCSSWGADLLYMGETCPFAIFYGNSQTGLLMPYGACLSSPILIVTINYYGSGLSETCSYCKVLGDPTATPPGIYVDDCSFHVPNRHTATGGTLVINPDQTCMCDVPAEETNWGRVKALYR